MLESPSIFFQGMAGSRLPIAVAHGEGYADFSQRGDAAKVQAAMRYVDHHGKPTEAYPLNPNGSPGGLTAVTTADGRFTAHHAARRARVPQRADELERRRRVGAEPVGAHVRQRAQVDRLTPAVGRRGPLPAALSSIRARS